MLDHFLFILRKIQRIDNLLITFNNLICCKSYRNLSPFGMILYQMHDTVNASVNRSTMIGLFTEILLSWTFLIFCNMDGMTHKLINTLIFGRRNRHNRNTKKCLHVIYSDRSTISSDFIHHIESKYHRNIKLNQLHRKVQISLYISSINNIYNTLWFLADYILPRNYLLISIGRQRINSGKIHHLSKWHVFYLATFSIDSNSRKITNMLVGTCKLIKKSRLSTVLITCKGKCDHGSFRKRLLSRLLMIDSTLTITGMLTISVSLLLSSISIRINMLFFFIFCI